MKYICWAARLVITLVLIQLTIIVINCIPTTLYEISWEAAIKPSTAIYHSINYIGANLYLSLELSYLLVLIIACILSIIYYKVGLCLTQYVRNKILLRGKKE